MMRNVLSVIFLVVSISFGTFGQDFGFFGKKNVVTLHATGNMRVLSGVSIPIVDKDRNGYIINRYTSTNRYNGSSKLFRYDLRASYKRVVSRRMAIGFEFGYEKFRLPSMPSIGAGRTPTSRVCGVPFRVPIGSPTPIYAPKPVKGALNPFNSGMV